MNRLEFAVSKAIGLVADGSSAKLAPADFVSHLPIETCRERLREGLGSRWTRGIPFALYGGKQVFGRLKDNKLMAGKRIGYSNPFQTRLTAILSERSGQTLIQCRFGLFPIVIVFFGLWIGFASIISVGALLAFVSAAVVDPIQLRHTSWLAIATPILFPIFGLTLTRIGRWLARDERAFLIDYICRTAEAHAVSPTHLNNRGRS